MDFVYDEDEYSDQELEDTTEIDYDTEDFNDDHDQALGNDSNNTKPDINYSVLNNDDIKNHLKQDVAKVCNLLAVSRASAIRLLLHYNWHVDNTLENWVGEEEKVRMTIGLLRNPIVNYSDSEITNCGICFEDYTRRNMKAVSCGHPYCNACWKGYLSTSITDGAGCLTLRCPEPKCGAVVGQDMIDELVSNRDKKKYYGHLMRSYVESSRSRKWCPAPGCDYVVEHTGDDGSGRNYDSITCNCVHSFCWSCSEDPHRPVDYDIISKWILKNKDESGNVKWIFAYTKPCPQCKKPIQKNQGCATMYCPAPCNFRFCWTCLRGLDDHRGGCNAYNTENTDEDTENRKKRAKEALDKYVHYYERWAGNKVSREKAIASLHELQTVHSERLRKVLL